MLKPEIPFVSPESVSDRLISTWWCLLTPNKNHRECFSKLNLLILPDLVAFNIYVCAWWLSVEFLQSFFFSVSFCLFNSSCSESSLLQALHVDCNQRQFAWAFFKQITHHELDFSVIDDQFCPWFSVVKATDKIKLNFDKCPESICFVLWERWRIYLSDKFQRIETNDLHVLL